MISELLGVFSILFATTPNVVNNAIFNVPNTPVSTTENPNTFVMERGLVDYQYFDMRNVLLTTGVPPVRPKVISAAFEMPGYIDPNTFQVLWDDWIINFEFTGNYIYQSDFGTSLDHWFDFTFGSAQDFDFNLTFTYYGNNQQSAFYKEMTFDLLFYFQVNVDLDGPISPFPQIFIAHITELDKDFPTEQEILDTIHAVNGYENAVLDTLNMLPFVNVRVGPNHPTNFSQEGPSYNNGYNQGFQIGKQEGYQQGYQQAESDLGGSVFANVFFSLLNTPFKVIQDVFDLEFFGINLSQLIIAIFSITLVIWLIDKFKGKGGSE